MTALTLLIPILLLFSPTHSSYLTGLAHDLAHLEQVTYDTQSNIDSWNCPECSNYQVQNQKSFFSSAANIQGYVAYLVKYQAILVAFRGSVDIKNWLANLNTVTTSYPACSGCSVHLGFYNAYKGVSPLVRQNLQNLFKIYPSAKLVITGHSLGGAMAAHCALDIKQTYGKTGLLYAFGQPRVGNQNFANYIQAQIPDYYRVINYADTVPHVPQSILGFKHGGSEIWYSPRGMIPYKVCQSEDKSCSNSIGLTSMSTDDHHLVYYMTLQVVNLQRERTEKTESQIKSENYTYEQIMIAEYQKVQKIKQLIKIENQLTI